MAYQALYRKWRPSVFEDVVGQKHIVDTLKNQISSGKIAHAYLFCGSRGTGKTSTAKIFSRAVNCEHPVNGDPCNECNTCKGILNGSIFDVVEIDGASHNKVDDVRAIIDEIVYPPASSKYKVYIIDEVHMLTTEAFNALLKTLEEPPSYVIFILATTEFHKIPATIISRCQKFDFKRITYNDTAKRIKKVAESDNISISDSAVKLIAKVADGSLRDGLSKLDQCLALGLSDIGYKDVANIIGASDPDFLADFCDAIIERDLKKSIEMLNDGINMALDPLRMFTEVIDYFRDLMTVKTSGSFSLIINSEDSVVTRYNSQVEKLTLPRILKIIETLFEGQTNAKFSASPKLAFETALLKIASKHTDEDNSSLTERISELENRVEQLEKGIVAQPVVDNDKDTEKDKKEEKSSVCNMSEYEKDFDNLSSEDEIKNSIDEDEEYSFEQSYEDGIEENGTDFNPTVDDFSFESEKSQSEAPIDLFEENDVEADGEQEECFYKEYGFLTADEVKDLALNFSTIIKNAENKDFGFDNIISSAIIKNEEDNLIIEFNSKTNYDIAKNNKYDLIIRDSVKIKTGSDIKIKLRFASKEEASENKKDPLEELIEIGMQDQITFNIE